MITSFWHEKASCWMHVFEANGWKLVLQENGTHHANMLLEGRGKGTEWLGGISNDSEQVKKFIEFMERFENASQ